MDSINKYQTIIKDVLIGQLHIHSPAKNGITRRLIINAEETEFILLHFGWLQKRYIHMTAFHIELKDSEVWLHQNNTDVPIEQLLVDAGVEERDLVFGYLEKALQRSVLM